MENKPKALIFDMDGVLWRDSSPLADLASIFSQLSQKEIHFAFATNNATRHIDQYVQKLTGHGILISPEQIFTSGKATAQELQKRHPKGGNLFVIGSQGLTQTLADHGFIHNPENPLAVVSALDTDFNYQKLRTATLLIRAGIPFIGTNPDPTFPIPEGLAPGAGSILAALTASTDIHPEIIGKPQSTMFIQAMAYLNTKPHETLVVGDRLETDIAGGQNASCKTALLLTGVTNETAASAWSPPPDLILNDLDELVEML